MKRFLYQLDGTIQVFRLGTTSNKKIAGKKEKIIQSYTYSIDQYNYVRNQMNSGTKAIFNDFFALDAKNCFDCPFSANANAGIGKCYTHKIMQYSGFMGMLKSIIRKFDDVSNIPTYSSDMIDDITKISTNKYVRFGTYGEPSLHPLELVEAIAKVSTTWTGYTHQYMKKENEPFKDYLMASTHNKFQANTASNKFGFRSFITVKDKNKGLGVICPASNEGGNKTTCANCGLCSGVTGKGKKDVVILQH